MDIFNAGETVICSIIVKNSSNVLQNPATSMKVKVYRARPYEEKVASIAMTYDSEGAYHYDCQTADYEKGEYEIFYTATDETRISIEKALFSLA